MPEPIEWTEPQPWPNRWSRPEPPTEPIQAHFGSPTELIRPEWVLPGHGEPTEGTEGQSRAWSPLARMTVAVACFVAVVTCLTILAVDIRILVIIWQP